MSISNEELLIRALVDDIYQTEEKINLLNESLNKDNSQNSTFKKIETLKTIKNNLIQQKLSLNDSLLLKTRNNSDVIQEKLDKIKDIENNLESKKNELIEFNILSFKCLQLKKFILSNKTNEFLTEEQINDIIFDGQLSSKNSEIHKLKREIEINKASECVIINNINDLSSKLVQVEENLKMIKEEKNIVKNELINLISCKETLEQIIKLNINGLNIHNKTYKKSDNDVNEKNNINNNKWTTSIDLYIFELNIIDTKKSANNICNDLFDLFNLNNDGTKKDVYNSKNRSLDKKKKNNINLNYFYNINENRYSSKDINNENKYYYGMLGTQILKNKNSIDIKSNINFSNNINYTNNNNLNIFRLNKHDLCAIIQNEIEKFINGKIYSYKTIPEFLENLSIIIISKFQLIDIIISSDTLTIYLSYFFKSLYYESVINSNIKFINKDYKTRKKEYQKLIPYLHSELSKLDTKYNEYKSKTKIIEKQIKMVKKEINKNKKKEPIKLSLEEESYIQICSKANQLMKQKNSIEETIKEYEKKNNKLKNENDIKLKKINKEMNKIDKQILKINEEIKNKKNKTSENIDYYQKIIQEKYNVIKKQLEIYKNKYGSNLDIYNRLINSINDTIKKTYDKSPLIIINNNNNINNSHIFNNEIGKIIQNYGSDSKNKNLKELILSENNMNMNYFLNSEKNLKMHNNINNKKDLFNFDFNMSTIDKSPFETNNRLDNINNISINNMTTKISIKNKKNMNIREKNIKKINDRRRLNKALSNLSEVSYMFNTTKKNPSIDYELEKIRLRTKNNSLNYNIRNVKDKTFYHSHIPNKMSYSKGNNSIYKLSYKSNNSMLSMNLNNYNLTADNNFIMDNNNGNGDEYEQSFFKNSNIKSSSIKNKSQILNLSNIKTDKFQSFPIINKNQFDYNIKNRSNGKMLFNSTYKKDKNILKTHTNSHQHTISNKIRKNYKNIIKNNLNNISGFLKHNENDISKFSHIKRNLNEKMIQEERTKLIEKLKTLTKLTYCYYRELNNELHKYNPLFDMPSEFICQPPYSFMNASISLTKKFDKIRIAPFGNNKIDFNIIDIDNTMVNSKIKLIIEVHRNYRKYKDSSKFKSIEDFASQQIKKYPQFTREEIEKCAKNKNFNFSLIINGGKVIELIICSYQEFKVWINGFAFLIKNKREILQLLKENENMSLI